MKFKQKVSPTTGSIQPSEHSGKWILLVILMSLGFTIVSLWVRQGGWLHGEADLFLVDHLSDRPFLSKVICPHAHDADQYQCRELSHVVEQVDADFIYFCTRLGRPHFYSIMNFVFLFVIVVANWRYADRLLKLDPWCSILLLGLFWSAPCIFMSGNYVRTAKQAVAFVLFFLVWYLFRHVVRGSAKPSWRLWVELFGMGLALSWLDRQGFFFAVCACITVILGGYWFRLQNWRSAASALAAAVCLHTVYNKLIGPIVVKAVVGREVSFSYQKLPWSDFWPKWEGYLKDGLSLTGDTMGYFLGNITGPLAICLVVFAAGAIAFSRALNAGTITKGTGRLSSSKALAAALLLWFGLMSGMNTLMVLRHSALTWPDSRLMEYYWIPATVLILLGGTFVLSRLLDMKLLSVKWTRLFLGALLVSNLFSLGDHLRVCRQGYAAGHMLVAPHLLKAIRDLYDQPSQPNNGTRVAYDTATSFLCTSFDDTLQNPLVQLNRTGNINMEEYLRSSHFYNFLRSKRGYDFVQPVLKEPNSPLK
jgi:hypothetical protein